MWTTREAWLAGLTEWTSTEAFEQCRQSAGVSITATTLVAIAKTMAAHADHATGRNCALTRSTIAERVGCDPQTVTRAWKLLRASEWAVEAQRGHGSASTAAAGRRPSIYHLVPLRQDQSAVRNVYLPPLGGVCSSRSFPKGLPSARARVGKSNSRPRRRIRAMPGPRPLAVQLLAAALVRDCHGLGRGHIGAVCTAIESAGLDVTAWTARSLRTALDADMRARQAIWPDRINNPGAFLASRLRRLPESPIHEPFTPTPGPVIQEAKEPASPAQRKAHKDAIDKILGKRKNRTHAEHP